MQGVKCWAPSNIGNYLGALHPPAMPQTITEGREQLVRVLVGNRKLMSDDHIPLPGDVEKYMQASSLAYKRHFS